MGGKVQERRLKWYGQVMNSEEAYVGRRMIGIDVEGRRRKGRPKRRWMDRVNVDLRGKGTVGRGDGKTGPGGCNLSDTSTVDAHI